jgi:hypothetical protein
VREALTLPVAFPSAEPRAVTGAVEVAVAEAAALAAPRAERVTAVIAAVFGRVGGVACDAGLVRRLASGARVWLLNRAAGLFAADGTWFQATCGSCGRPFDFAARLSDAPRKRAGPAFPVVEVPTSLGPRRFEVPNGAHEEAAGRRRGDPRRVLAGLCGLADDAAAEAERLTEADLDRIEAILDDAAPDVADTVTTACPECGAETEVALDPLGWAFPRPERLIRDTHLIARTYGWSEEAILALPRGRRRAYADTIAAEGGRVRP